MNPIPYGKQSITEADIKAVAETLKSDFLTQGPKIGEFEKAFADYIGCKYAVAVSNGTAALHLCALALGVNSQSNVITTPITFAASANCIKYCDGNVFFADIDPQTYCLDIKKVRTLIESKPKGFFTGLIPVDFAGYALDMQQFRELADENDLWIIEDACHAPGAFFTDSNGQIQRSGNGVYSDLAIYSFHPVKHIACGEGGMITTNNEQLYKKLLLLRTHGITKDPLAMEENHGGWYYEMQELGYNYRLTDMQAALGISQLSRADEGLTKRKKIANKYYHAFKEQPFILGQSGIPDGHAYHLYVIEVEDRKGLYDFLKANNIFSQVHYIPVHTLPFYKSLGFKKGDFPLSEKYYDRCLSLPMYPGLQDREQDFVIEKIIGFFNG
jgi:UDP-4-amino-4,6-dideoxy-N-acetyl-beta-L-altrosamine transaminase